MKFRIRDASVEDVPAIARLHVETFRETHGGGPPYELRLRQWQDAFGGDDGSWFCLVIEDLEDQPGALVGFAKGTPHDGGVPGYEGELNKIYVLRRLHRNGLGRILLCNVSRRFVERGVNSMLLFGDARSPSNGFYERMGAQRLHSPEGQFHGGYGWRDLKLLLTRCYPA